jgi:hypothetical protein
VRQQVLQLGNRLAEQLTQLIEPYFLRREKQKPQAADGNLLTRLTHAIRSSGNSSATETPSATATVDSQQSLLQTPTTTAAPTSRNISLTPPAMTVRKNDFIVWIKMVPTQVEMYRAFLQSEAVAQALNDSGSVLAAITVLKKICDHPALLHEQMKSLQDVNIGNALLLSKDRFRKNGEALLYEEIEHLVAQSGKMQFMVSLLMQLRLDGHRVLIFSQSTRMLDIIQGLLHSERMQMRFVRIDGSITSIDERQKLIDTFNCDTSYTCFLLTTQVGGVGISLTGADRVIIVDPAWNDIDNQAVDRAYRLGQKRNVVVYRLMTCGAIEEKIYRKQVFKVALTRKVLTNGKNQYRYFKEQELRELLALSDPEYSETQVQLAHLHAADRSACADLTHHIDYLHSLSSVFGISDHDLLFSKPEHQCTAMQSPTALRKIDQKALAASAKLDRTRSELRPTAAFGPATPMPTAQSTPLAARAAAAATTTTTTRKRRIVIEPEEEHEHEHEQQQQELPHYSLPSPLLDQQSQAMISDEYDQNDENAFLSNDTAHTHHGGQLGPVDKLATYLPGIQCTNAVPVDQHDVYQHAIEQADVLEQSGDKIGALTRLLDALDCSDKEKWLHVKIMQLADELRVLNQ